MAIDSRSYGTVAEVIALTKRYTNGSSAYDTTTNPTLVQVEKWVDNASATLNVLLSVSGFTVPIIQADAKAACAEIVVEVAVEMCHAANSTGRFFTDKALAAGRSPMIILRKEMAEWVKLMAAGLENLGVPRSSQAVVVTSTVVNPQFERTVVENNDDTTTDWTEVI